MEFQAVSATFAAKLKKGIGNSPYTLFLENLKLLPHGRSVKRST